MIDTIVVIVVAFFIGYVIVSIVIRVMNSAPPNTGRHDGFADNANKRKSEESQRQRDYQKQQEEQGKQEKSQQQKEREKARQTHHEREEEESGWRAPPSTGNEVKGDRYYANILGLHGQVSVNDVKRHYRSLVMQYHPDKVNHLGPKLREVAEREMKEINIAFEYFKNKYGIE